MRAYNKGGVLTNRSHWNRGSSWHGLCHYHGRSEAYRECSRDYDFAEPLGTSEGDQHLHEEVIKPSGHHSSCVIIVDPFQTR